MNYRNIFILLISFVIVGQFSFGQNREATMTFKTETHQFGTIEEEKGDAMVKFEFTNTGADPIVITDVRSSCGCTTPKWSVKPVGAGENGFITAIFHPKNRPGAFSKTITVYSNAANSPVKLIVKGNVIEKPTEISDEYRYKMGKIRLKKNNIHFSEMYQDEVKKENIEIINVSEVPVTVTLSAKRNKPKHIGFSVKPATLKPGEKGHITVEYSANLKNDWDYVRDRLYLDINGTFDSKYTIRISGYIKEKFTDADLKNPPAIEFVGKKTFDFGTLEQGEKATHKFLFKNTGGSNLIIRKVRSSCGCTATVSGDKVIEPGKESFIEATFSSKGKKGKQNKMITVITNIPGKTDNKENARQILKITGMVNTGDKE